MIGVSPQQKLELLGPELKKYYPQPVLRNSAAAAARLSDLKPGDQVLATTDPDDTAKMKPVKDLRELGERLRALAGEKMQLLVLRAGKGEEMVELPSEGFQFGDVILGTSDVAPSGKKYDPFVVTPLPPDPRSGDDGSRDPFAFRKQMRLLAG